MAESWCWVEDFAFPLANPFANQIRIEVRECLEGQRGELGSLKKLLIIAGLVYGARRRPFKTRAVSRNANAKPHCIN